MRVGITILPEYRWSEAAPLWRAAQDYGFDHAWTFDHLGWRSLVDGPWFSAVSTLAAAATVTSTIRLGTLVSTPNFRHPVPLAREALGLEDISGGRFTLGLGSGSVGDYDSTVFGGQPLRQGRLQRFAEFVELTDALLQSSHVNYDGEYFSAADARNTPGCLQQPRLPFVVAANGPMAMRLAARYGQGWITTGEPSEDLEQWWEGVGRVAQAFDEAQAAAQAAIQAGGGGADTDIAPDTIRRYLQTDAAPVYSLSSAQCFADFLGRAQDHGFTDLVVPWPRREGIFAGSRDVLEEIAADGALGTADAEAAPDA